MTSAVRNGPDTTAVPWLPVMPLWQATLGATVLGAGIAVVVRLLGQPLWCAAVAGVVWVVASVVPQTSVQLRIGGGRLDNRLGLRIGLAAVLFATLGTAAGAGFLVPLLMVSAAMVHVQWSGPDSWRTCTAALVTATAAGQTVVVLGLVRCLVPTTTSVVLAAASTGVALAVLTYFCHVAAHREQHARTLERAARLDPLTGVLARAALLTDLERLLLRARPGAGLGLLFCDLDGFKGVNDTHGHRVGDDVLARTARRLLAAVPVGALVGRVGGDEFVVAVRDVVDPVFLAEVARAVGAAVARPVELPDGGTVDVGVTLGAAWSDDPGRSADDLVAAADAAMYERKNSARA